MINSLPFAFFLPLVVHILAALITGITGVVMFTLSKSRVGHQRWEAGYVGAYTVVFLTATILSVQRWEADALLFFLAVIGYGLALGAYVVRRFWQEPQARFMAGKRWVAVHIVGMNGSYVVLWTAFLVDNAHKIPGVNRLPPFTYWALPCLIGLLFLVLSLSRLAAKQVIPARWPRVARKGETI